MILELMIVPELFTLHWMVVSLKFTERSLTNKSPLPLKEVVATLGRSRSSNDTLFIIHWILEISTFAFSEEQT